MSSAGAGEGPSGGGSAESGGGGDRADGGVLGVLESVFSLSNLRSDAALLSQMDASLWVSVAAVQALPQLAAAGATAESVVEAAKASDKVVYNEGAGTVKPNIKAQRNVIILRDIPGSTGEDEVRALFEAAEAAAPTAIRSDIGDTWFVTMASEDDAMKAVLGLRSVKFGGSSVKARIKSENLLRTLMDAAGVEQPMAQPQIPSGPPAAGTAPAEAAGMGAGGYYAGSGGWYPPTAGMPWYGGSAYDGSTAPYDAYGGVSGGDVAGYEAGGYGGYGTAWGAPGAYGQYEPAMARKPGYSGSFTGYSDDKMMAIIRGMPRDKITRPATMDASVHPELVSVTANTALLSRGRTVSIDQAVRHGRPVRTASVDTVDYESLLYGEADGGRRRRSRADSMSSNHSSGSRGRARSGSTSKSASREGAPPLPPAATSRAPSGYAAALLAKPSPEAAARAEAARAKKGAARSGDNATGEDRSSKAASGGVRAGGNANAHTPGKGGSKKGREARGSRATQDKAQRRPDNGAVNKAASPPRKARGWEKPEVTQARKAAAAAAAAKPRDASDKDEDDEEPVESRKKASPSQAPRSAAAAASAPAASSTARAEDASASASASAASTTPSGSGGDASASGWGAKGSFADVLRKPGDSSDSADQQYRDFGGTARRKASAGSDGDAGYDRVDRGDKPRGRADASARWR